MAVMRKCCCFSNTRSGTLASAIVSLMYSAIFCGLTAASYSWAVLIPDTIIRVMFYASFVLYGVVFICSIIAMIGVSKDIAGLLMPYIIALLAMMIVELASYIVWLTKLGFAALILIIPFVIWVLFLSLNLVCLLCAISQFQELKAGRGRIQDIQTRRTTTVVMTGGTVITQQPPTTTFIVQQQPPAYGQPIQQGYAQPPHQTGYPPQSGYPPQTGYPPQQGGYPPEQQQPLNQIDGVYKA